MSNGTASTTTTPVGAVASGLADILKSDLLKAGLPSIQTFLNNIIANSDPVYVAGQFVALQANLVAALPMVEKGLIADLAALIQKQIAGLAAPAPTAAAKA